MTPSEHQSLERIRVATGRRIRLQRWESIEAVLITDTGIMLMIDTYRVRVLVREDRYEAHGRRVLSWSRPSTDARWHLSIDTTTWDDTFVPYVFSNFSTGGWRGDEYYSDDRTFADDCHRPGTDAHPMDNFDRTAEYPDATPRMARHWKINS